MNQAADDFYAGHTEMARFRQLQRALVNTVSQEAARVAKKLFLQEQSQADAQKIQDYRIRGEMLLAHLHLIKRGQTVAHLPNLYDPEAPPLEIELNPSLTPSQNAQQLFRRYEKARNTLQINKLQMALTMDEQQYLSSVKTALDLAETVDELNEIRTELEQARYVKSRDRKRKDGHAGGEKPQQKSLPQVSRIISADGLEILVGKNNRQNDYLTMHLAKKEDMWLHAKDIPGAHVVINPTGRGSRTPPCYRRPNWQPITARAGTPPRCPSTHAPEKRLETRQRPPGSSCYDHYQTLLVALKPPEAMKNNRSRGRVLPA